MLPLFGLRGRFEPCIAVSLGDDGVDYALAIRRERSLHVIVVLGLLREQLLVLLGIRILVQQRKTFFRRQCDDDGFASRRSLTGPVVLALLGISDLPKATNPAGLRSIANCLLVNNRLLQLAGSSSSCHAVDRELRILSLIRWYIIKVNFLRVHVVVLRWQCPVILASTNYEAEIDRQQNSQGRSANACSDVQQNDGNTRQLACVIQLRLRGVTLHDLNVRNT